MAEAAVLLTALLFGGMVLYSFGFAAFVFNHLPSEIAGKTIRAAFPHFYLFVLATSALAAAVFALLDPVGVAVMGAIALTTILARQILMPAINRATDEGRKRAFAVLHGASVIITLLHIGGAGYVLTRLV